MASVQAPSQQLTRDDDERYELLRELKRCIGNLLEASVINEEQSENESGQESHAVAKLATIKDEAASPRVRELIAWLERTLWHGLRRTRTMQQPHSSSSSSSSSGLNDRSTSPALSQAQAVTLWDVIRHLDQRTTSMATQEEEEKLIQTIQEVSECATVTTDLGRSRLWVRLALNARVVDIAASRIAVDPWYDTYSVWAASEQRLVAVSLLSSLRGLEFALDPFDLGALDVLPPPSRRPHLLGVASRHLPSKYGHYAPNNLPNSSLFAYPRGAAENNLSLPESSEVSLRRAQRRGEIEALRSKTLLPGPPSPMGAALPRTSLSSASTATSGFTSWMRGAIDGLVTTLQESTSLTDSQSTSANAQQRIGITRVATTQPSLLGSSLYSLVRDPRTCSDALLDWQIGVPNAIITLLTMIEMSVGVDPFDVLNTVSLEDDPRFLKEIASLLGRLNVVVGDEEDHGQTPSSDRLDSSTYLDCSPCIVAVAALKLFLRQLPVPLIPFDVYDALTECQRIGNSEARNRNVKLLVDALPTWCKPTLFAIVRVTSEACESGRTNSIAASEALAPSLLRCRPGPDLGRATDAAEVLQILIENRVEVLGEIEEFLRSRRVLLEEKTVALAQWHSDIRKSVEWPHDQALLRRLWASLSPNGSLTAFEGPVSEGWRQRGFRSPKASDDFRGCGRASLRHLVYFAENDGEAARNICARHLPSLEPLDRMFPFALGAAQISRGVNEILGLDPRRAFKVQDVARLSMSWRLYLGDEDFSSKVFCLAVRLVDYEWKRQNASAWDFNRIKQEVMMLIEDTMDQPGVSVIKDFDALCTAVQKRVGGSFVGSPPKSKPQQNAEGPATSTGATEVLTITNETPTAASTTAPDFLPVLISSSECLTSARVVQIEATLPYEYHGYDWERVFSAEMHGSNLAKLYELAGPHTATILCVLDANTQIVMGAFCTEAWTASHGESKYYGGGQSFLFRFMPSDDATGHERYDSFKWTELNPYFMLSGHDSLAVGSGGTGFGLYLDGDLAAGTTSASATFGNPPLLSNDPANATETMEFTCRAVELWKFVPKSSKRRRASSLPSVTMPDGSA